MSQRKADFLLALVSMAWGSSYLLMKLGLQGLGAFNLIALRFGVAFLVTAVIFRRRVFGADFRTIMRGAVLGLALFGLFAFLMFGLKTTTASSAGFLTSTSVIFVFVMQIFLTRKKPTVPVMLGIGITIFGIALLTIVRSLSLEAGAGLCLLGAFFRACHIILTDRWAKESDSAALGVFQLGFAALFGLIASMLFERPALPQNTSQWVAVLGLGLVCSAFGFVAQPIAQKFTTPERVGVIFSLEPVFSALFGFVFLREILPVQGYVGAILVLCGVFVSGIKPKYAETVSI